MANQLTRYATVATVDTAGEGYFIGAAVHLVSTGVLEPAGVANQVLVYQFVLPFRATIREVITEVTTLVAASLYSCGIYTPDGNTLLINSGTFNGATTGIKSNVIAAVTLDPDVYLFAQTANTTTTLVTRSLNLSLPCILLTGGAVVRCATAANASAAGVLPATLGALTSTTRMPMMAVFSP